MASGSEAKAGHAFVPIYEAIYKADGVVRIEDLDWPDYDPERPYTLPEFLGEIGLRMSDVKRESAQTDSGLQVYGNDFERAEPSKIESNIYWPNYSYLTKSKRPVRYVVNPKEKYCDLEPEKADPKDPDQYPGLQDAYTGVAVNEEFKQFIIYSPADMTNSIANIVERPNDKHNVEEATVLGYVAASYVHVDNHQMLEDIDLELIEQKHKLHAVLNNVFTEARHEKKRAVSLDEYRVSALSAIQDMARISYRLARLGTTSTRGAMNAVASNVHRSENPASWLGLYTSMAMNYNDAVRGKINQAIHGLGDEIHYLSEFMIQDIDREFTDKKTKNK
jgi:hypothetical protein